MSEIETILILRLVAAVMLVVAVIPLAIAYRRREEAPVLHLCLTLLLLLNGFILASSFVRELWPTAERVLIVASYLLLPVIIWLLWKSMRQHLRSVGLASGSEKED
jgi:hypothetical protein